MPKKILDEFGMSAAPEKHGSARVPEVVPANKAKYYALQQGLGVQGDDVRASTAVPIVGNTRPLSRQ